jgi:hypothetical protein
MRSALNKARERLQNGHPAASHPAHRVRGLVCDLVLATAASAFLGGLVLVAWAALAGFEPIRLYGGLTLVVLGPMLLLAWEHLFWEPFVRDLSRMS